MKEGIFHVTETTPVIAPHNPATTNPPTAAGNGPHPRLTTAPLTAEPATASTEPTDKSLPPIINTNVIPTDITSRSGISLVIVLNVFAVRKCLEMVPNRTIIADNAVDSPT